MKRVKALLLWLLRREPAALPDDPFGEPGGREPLPQTADSVAGSRLPLSTLRAH